MSKKVRHQSLTADQKIEVLQAGLRGDRSVRDVCREYEVSEASFYEWRDLLLAGGRNALLEEPAQTGRRRHHVTEGDQPRI
jgi:transposase